MTTLEDGTRRDLATWRQKGCLRTRPPERDCGHVEYSDGVPFSSSHLEGRDWGPELYDLHENRERCIVALPIVSVEIVGRVFAANRIAKDVNKPPSNGKTAYVVSIV